MSRDAMWERVRAAWSMLSGGGERDVRPGRPREPKPPPAEETPRIAAEGFAEEALPWLDAVYRFSLRLTWGDQDAAEDLVQDTFLRAHRFWHTYERGTNAKSWLFTICRNTYLHQKELVRNQREQPAASASGIMRRRHSVIGCSACSWSRRGATGAGREQARLPGSRCAAASVRGHHRRGRPSMRKAR